MFASGAVRDDASAFRFTSAGAASAEDNRQSLQYLRAAGLAQARLQLAVLSGNRRRALEQIDRLVAIDKRLEDIATGHPPAEPADDALKAELADQRLAIATEKLALTAGVELPRLEPAFGGGMAAAIAPEEPVEVVEDEAIAGRLRYVLLFGLVFLLLCLGVTAALLIRL